MSKQQTQVTTPILLPVTSNDQADSGNILKKYLYHWPLFFLSVVIMLGVAYYYLKVATPVYPITATLKFTGPAMSSGVAPPKRTESKDPLDPGTNPIIVENEIEVIQSKKLIYQVVKDRNLWVSYLQKQGLSTMDLYDKSPVLFNFVDTNLNLSSGGDKFEIVLKDNNSFMMNMGGINKDFKYSTTVKSAFGNWQLKQNPNFKNYIGSKIIIKVTDPEQVADNYQNRIQVSLENKYAPFLNLSMSDNVPSRGKDVLNSLMALYIHNSATEKNNQTGNLLSFVTGRVDSLKQDLDAQEKMLEEYQRSEGITDIARQAESYRKIKDFNASAVNDVNVELSNLFNLEKYANSSSANEPLPAGGDNLSDHSLIILQNRLSDLQLQREQKLTTIPEGHPLIVSLDRQIIILKDDIKQRIKTIKSNLLDNNHQIESFGSGIQSSLSKVPYQEKQYNALKRSQVSKEAMYKILSAKREELALRYASIIPDSEIVDDAHAGGMKWPKPLIVYGVALVLGLLAATGLIYARENLNDQITSRKQIEKETDVPILGELSYLDATDDIVVTGGRNKFAIGEQFRMLRTNLYHLHGNNESGRVTLFTSSVSGEGKSFVSSNLAVTLAYASRKTIILEMDLRKPKVSVVFNLSTDHPGISDYLAEQSSNLELMIRPSGIPGLDVLSSGSILPNPSELVGKARLDELIDELRKMYDDIIIDSPPIHLVTDALIIARVADASLYVIRQGYTHKSELDFINEINTSERFKKFTVIFNGVKKESSGEGDNKYNHYNLYTDKQKPNFGVMAKRVLRRF